MTGAAEPVMVRAAHRELTDAFRRAGLDTPALDARLLLAAVLGIAPSAVPTITDRALTQGEVAGVAAFRDRRLAHEPVSRILGHRAFFGLDLEIGPATLDPRPDTETLVDGVLQLVRAGQFPRAGTPRRILDLGTGTGAIILALLAQLPEASGVGVDIAPAALAVARRNAHRHGLAGRAEFLQSDWLAAVTGTFDLVVSNPPYIPTGEIAGLAPDVREWDPRAALDGGADGLAAYRAIVEAVRPFLAVGGWLVMEVGAGQSDAVVELVGRHAGFTTEAVQVWDDLGGIARCVASRAG
jgi:release factor glutamine methyltransferase